MIPLQDDNPTQRTPIVTVVLIGICIAVFLYQVNLPQAAAELFAFQYGAIPAIVFGHASLSEEAVMVPASLTLVTSMFLHGGWMHLLGNMLYLWIFGNNIEDAMGHMKFIVFYVLTGILAALSHAITDPYSQIPMVGASGAISAVLGAYLLLFPHAHVLVLLPAIGMIRVAAGIVLGMWFITQLISGGMSMGATGGGVAFFAPLGGFLAGMALIGLFKRKEVRFFSPGRSTWSS
ncbi:rhomboid family intramembrane serine protease [Nitrospira sp. BLG_2]|uniref:rhomboid family intramembrane serine protease n=1 Tax=Nitrospira sp. BLG_2 TaxID=3397507 RepID=UPI003B997AB2